MGGIRGMENNHVVPAGRESVSECVDNQEAAARRMDITGEKEGDSHSALSHALDRRNPATGVAEALGDALVRVTRQVREDSADHALMCRDAARTFREGPV